MLNSKKKSEVKKKAIKVGEAVIIQESYTKLLGLKIEDNQKWTVRP